MAHPFPVLRNHATSNLSFAWSDFHGSGPVGTFDASLGTDGTQFGMVMVIDWNDLRIACQEILGHSVVDPAVTDSLGRPILRRIPPWQHPYFNQLYAKRITKIQGVRIEGNSVTNILDTFPVPPAGAGVGFPPNLGPWTNYNLALLTIQFWRPPYAIRSALDIYNSPLGIYQEWLRWTDRTWTIGTQMLCREGTTYTFLQPPAANGSATGKFTAPVGTKIVKTKLKRRWYELPEAALFQANVDVTPSGLPRNLLYTQTSVPNPITGYVYRAGNPIAGCVNAPMGGITTLLNFTGKITAGVPQITAINPGTAALAPGFYVDGTGPAENRILSVDSPTQVTCTANATVTDVSGNHLFAFEDPTEMFWGFHAGTLLLESVEITPRALHLPPDLMQIPTFGGFEPKSQVQYDVIFNFEHFDPPRAPGGSHLRGHNLCPFSGDTMWYLVQGINNVSGTTTKTSPYQYVDFSDLFGLVTP